MNIFRGDATDFGYAVGICLFFGFYFHWTHFITAGIIVFLILLMDKEDDE